MKLTPYQITIGVVAVAATAVTIWGVSNRMDRDQAPPPSPSITSVAPTDLGVKPFNPDLSWFGIGTAAQRPPAPPAVGTWPAAPPPAVTAVTPGRAPAPRPGSTGTVPGPVPRTVPAPVPGSVPAPPPPPPPLIGAGVDLGGLGVGLGVG